MNNPLNKTNVREVNAGLYAVNEGKQLVDHLEALGVDVDEERLRLEHLQKQLEYLRDHFGGAQ